jgi:hypothetical protein
VTRSAIEQAHIQRHCAALQYLMPTGSVAAYMYVGMDRERKGLAWAPVHPFFLQIGLFPASFPQNGIFSYSEKHIDYERL